MQAAILVGHHNGVVASHDQADREAYHGYRVIGCCLPPAVAGGEVVAFDGLPTLGTLDEVVDVVRRYEVDTVAVLPPPELDGPALPSAGRGPREDPG